MKRVPRLAWALAPTTGHWELSGQRGPVAVQRGHGEDGGAPHHCRPSSGTSTDWNHAEPGQPDPSLCICKSTVALSGWEQERISSLGKRIFPSRIWDCLLVRAKQGLSEGLLWWVQLYWLIAREGSARQLFCSGLHPLKLSFNYCCCHSDQVLLCLYLLIPLCVPALNLAFTFRSAVLHRDDSKEYEEKATTCHLVHLPAQWWLRFEWKIFFSPFPLPFKDLFDLYLFTSLSD